MAERGRNEQNNRCFSVKQPIILSKTPTLLALIRQNPSKCVKTTKFSVFFTIPSTKESNLKSVFFGVCAKIRVFGFLQVLSKCRVLSGWLPRVNQKCTKSSKPTPRPPPHTRTPRPPPPTRTVPRLLPVQSRLACRGFPFMR